MSGRWVFVEMKFAGFFARLEIYKYFLKTVANYFAD